MTSPTTAPKKRLLAIKKRKEKSADGTMSIVEHIQELRQRLFASLLVIGIGTIFGYFWYGSTLGPIPSLGDILKEPYCSLDPTMRLSAADGQCALLATSPFEMFLLRLKVGSLAGLVVTSPFWIAQIWGYITPGLKKNERRWTFGVGSAAGVLFLAGAVVAYFVLSYGLEFLMSMGDNVQISALNGEKYFTFVLALIAIFGVSFEVPLITVLLNLAGVISYDQLQSKRRYIWAFLFVFAAFATPGQDPFSMVILALALCLLMEMATQIARINDKRRKRERPDWLDAGDEESTSIGAAAPITSPDSLGSASDIGGAAAIERPTSVSEQYPAGVATPAPRSSSGARPVTQSTYGRREGLDLRAHYGSGQQVTSNQNNQTDSHGGQQPNNGGAQAGGYFDDVL